MKNMELTIEEPKKSVVPDGLHNGTIIKIEDKIRGEKKYAYTDITIKPDDAEVELRIGFPSNVSINTSLGKLLKKFGVKLEVGAKINPETILKGQRIQFQTTTDESKGFSRIIKGTIKPLIKLDE